MIPGRAETAGPYRGCPILAAELRAAVAAASGDAAIGSRMVDHIRACEYCWQWMRARLFDLEHAGGHQSESHVTEDCASAYAEELLSRVDEAWLLMHIDECAVCWERVIAACRTRLRRVAEFKAQVGAVGSEALRRRIQADVRSWDRIDRGAERVRARLEAVTRRLTDALIPTAST